MIRLRVWANARPMGWFGHAAGEYFFEYDPQWLAQPGGYVLAPQFALSGERSGERFSGALVRSFFENLLPEGGALDDVVNALALRDPSAFELLGRLGKDLPGVLSLLAECAGRRQHREPASVRRLPVAGPRLRLEVPAPRRFGQPAQARGRAAQFARAGQRHAAVAALGDVQLPDRQCRRARQESLGAG